MICKIAFILFTPQMNFDISKIIETLDKIIEDSGGPLEGNCYYAWGNKTNNDTIIIQSLANKRLNYQQAIINKKNVCEIGFNAGHSLLYMLLVNPTAEYTLFDLGEHLYSKPCLEYIRSLFPTTKIKMFWGDSRKTMVEYLSNPSHQTFDCIHIDGGHTPEVFEKDWVNSYSLAKDNAIIIFNDTDLPVIHCFVNDQIKKNLAYESVDFLETQRLEHRILIKIPQLKQVDEKPVLLWVGDDYRKKTGYGRVAKELFPYLYRDYKVVQYAITCIGFSNEYYIIDSQDGTAFGFNKLPVVINVIKPQIIILLNDSNIIHGWLSAINNNATIDKKCMIFPYVCTEYIGVPENEIVLYNKTCAGLLAMAQFTIDEFNKNGSILKSYRLSHGYANNIKKIDKSLAKKIMNVPEDTFVFFSGSKNQPRKRLDIIIRAFVHLLTRQADKKVLLMFNCGLIDTGWNLKELYIRLCKENNIQNMEKYIYFCSNNIGDSNKNDEELTVIYNAADVGITTSTGESFGLIPFEQSALGVPQIIPNWGGIVEAVPYGSIKVDTNDYYVYPVVLQSCNGEARTVYYKDVANAMETYLLDESLYKQHCVDVVKNVEKYNWDNIYNELSYVIQYIGAEKVSKTQDVPLLCDIVDNTLTDKNTTHSYLDLYEKLLNGKRNTAKNVLEIGIGDFKEKNGGSVKMWFDYFKQANIFCLDIIPINRVVDELINKDRITLYMETDAYDENTVNSLFKNNNIVFDFMLDDGPHTLESMLQYIKLYSQLMADDGILIIEDVQRWGWINTLKSVVPVELKKYIHTYDLRKNKNRYDDIVFTINKCIKPNFINENKITIILTCTVNVNIGKSFLAQISPKERTIVYIKSILQWLNDTTFNIVVIENSGYKFEELYAETEKYKDRFEIITFNENTHEKSQYLKNNNSKGDSELFSINYAFNNSKLIHSSNFIIKVTGRYFIPTLEDYLLEFNLNEYECLTQNNRDRCEMVGCHYTHFLNIFNTDIDDINKNDVGYSYNGHVETLWKYRTSKYKNLHCNEFQIETTQRGGINEWFNNI